MCRGGTLIRRLRISPRVTASRYSIMASMCHPGTNGVRGSMTAHAWSTNSRKLRAAISRSTFARTLGFANQEDKLFELFIGQIRKLGRRADRDRTPVRAAEFIGDVILVPQKILGQEDVGRRLSLVGQAPQVASKRYPSASLAAR